MSYEDTSDTWCRKGAKFCLTVGQQARALFVFTFFIKQADYIWDAVSRIDVSEKQLDQLLKNLPAAVKGRDVSYRRK